MVEDPRQHPAWPLVEQAGRDNGLDPAWFGQVLSLHLRADTAWRDKCCGSLCDPCVMQLARAVDRLRVLLEAPRTGEVP